LARPVTAVGVTDRLQGAERHLAGFLFPQGKGLAVIDLRLCPRLERESVRRQGCQTTPRRLLARQRRPW
jgi:hypothetical protein